MKLNRMDHDLEIGMCHVIKIMNIIIYYYKLTK